MLFEHSDWQKGQSGCETRGKNIAVKIAKKRRFYLSYSPLFGNLNAGIARK